jgi:recombination protein RecT
MSTATTTQIQTAKATKPDGGGELATFDPYAPIGTIQGLSGLLNTRKVRDSIATALPKHVTPERLIKTLLVAANRQPDLLQCTQSSILETINRAAELGLDLSGTLGEAYAVPFNNKIKWKDDNGHDRETWVKQAQFIPGYRGLAKLAWQSGEIRRIEAEVVYVKDKFIFRKGLNGTLEFEPFMDGDRGEEKGAYALVEMKAGGVMYDYMSKADIERVRNRAQSKNSPAWRDHWPEMAKKTVFRRVAKWLPLSTEKFTRAIESDDTDFEMVDALTTDAGNAGNAPPARGTKALVNRLSGGNGGGVADPYGQPVELPPAPSSDEEANRIIEERAAQTRAAEAAKSEAAPAPASSAGGIDPRDEYGEWLQQMHQVAAEVGMDGKDLDARLKREVMLKKGLVGKEWELPKSERAALAEVLKERRGIFA